MARGESVAATLDFSWLRSRFSGELIAPGNASYDRLRRTDNLAFDRHPALIARCTNTNDVVQVLEFARTHPLPLAVRGGGHSLAGYSSCDGGVIVDLAKMHAVSVDRRARLMTCGGGVRVWQANEAGAKQGMVLPLGICPGVGISGLTLGGGSPATRSSPPRSNALASAMWRANCRKLHSIDSSTTTARRLRYASYFLIQSMARLPAPGRMPLRFLVGPQEPALD